MRQGQQNRRGRGRNNNNNNNNNRKNQNPLTRSFESAGPDIKIRGNPSHIAEKYVSLARDALSSGDPVLAENYLQHAEHYNRIILTFREQQMSQQGGEPHHGGQNRTHGLNSFDHDNDESQDDDADEASAGGVQQSAVPGDGPQPFVGGGRENGGYRQDRGDNRHQQRHQQQGRGDRGERYDRHNNQGNGQDSGGPRRRDRYQDGGPNGRRDQRFTERGGEPSARATVSEMSDEESNEQPAFLRRPVRRTARRSTEDNVGSNEAVAAASDDQE